MRAIPYGLGFVGLVLTLTSCFLVGDPPYTYGVSLVVNPPEGEEPICHEIAIIAILGQNTILDVVRNVDDGIGYASGSEARASGAQSYFVGMPLDVNVSCRDHESSEVGTSHYSATLADTSSNAHLTVWNYLADDLEQQCVEPTAQTGVQLCATIAEGFSMEPID